MLQLMDNYAATYSTLMVGLCECIAIAWVYGESKVVVSFSVFRPFLPRCNQ